MVTFAVIGRNEAPRLPAALRDVCEAAGPGDRVVFVDGSSSDGSAQVARDHGVEVLAAPPGKGRAMDVALGSVRGGYVCFFDADLDRSERNIALVLRRALDADDPAMLVGAAHEPARTLRVVRTLYPALVRALFPEALESPGLDPLSGFRALATDASIGRLPPGYGAETYLNLRLTMEGRRVAHVDVGEYAGPLHGYACAPPIAVDVTAAILDAAERYGRLAPTLRSRWEGWAAPLIDLTRQAVADPARCGELTERASELAGRPLPPTSGAEPG